RSRRAPPAGSVHAAPVPAPPRCRTPSRCRGHPGPGGRRSSATAPAGVAAVAATGVAAVAATGEAATAAGEAAAATGEPVAPVGTAGRRGVERDPFAHVEP